MAPNQFKAQWFMALTAVTLLCLIIGVSFVGCARDSVNGIDVESDKFSTESNEALSQKTEKVLQKIDAFVIDKKFFGGNLFFQPDGNGGGFLTATPSSYFIFLKVGSRVNKISVSKMLYDSVNVGDIVTVNIKKGVINSFVKK